MNKLSERARIIRLEQTTSTMDETRALALSGAAHGTVVIAERQTKGRGRLGRDFFSPKGSGLYMSIVLKPDELFHDEHSSGSSNTAITAFAGLCVCEAIQKVFNIDAKIKWVNDVLVNDKKVCGILTEALVNQTGVFAFILGIGVNVFAPPEGFPDEIKNRAGAVCPGESHGDTDKIVLRDKLAAEIINQVLHAPVPGEAELFARYRQKLSMLGKNITVTQGGESFNAVALDIDGEGRLIVRKDNGELEALLHGDVSVRI